jgi:glycine/D-amino acid oxidase-like deaminating enzyme
MQLLTIIGGGIAGCLAAWQAAEAGYQVRLYEPKRLGAEASGLALGVLVPSTSARPLDDLQRAGCAAWESLAPRLAELSGTHLPQLYRVWPRGGQLNLAVMFGALEKALLQLGVEIVTQHARAPATTGLTLWAAGWENRAVLPDLTIRAGVACRLAPCGLNDLLVGMGPGVQGIYAVPAWDGSVLLGSQKLPGDELYVGAVPTETLAELRSRAARLLAPLGTAEVLEAWVGNRPTSIPRLPLLRPVGAQAWAVAGLGGLGYALAPVVAQEFLAAISATRSGHSQP